jgi:SOS-response transcriptional repressor LexA
MKQQDSSSVDGPVAKLTERQSDILAFLQVYGHRHGRYPSIAEIATGTGRTLNAVHEILNRLRDAGLVSWEEGKKRTLAVHVVANVK